MISGLGYYPNVLSPDAEEANQAVTQIRAVITAAVRLRVGRVNTFVGRDWTKSVDDNWPRFLETWRPLIQHAEQHDVKVGIENCPMLFTADEWPGGKNLAHSPAIWERMFNDIPSDHFGLNYDPSHMIFQQMDYLAPMREFSDRLFHIHAKDVRVDQQKLDRVGILARPNEYHTPKLPGLGGVDWGQVLFDADRHRVFRPCVCRSGRPRLRGFGAVVRTCAQAEPHVLAQLRPSVVIKFPNSPCFLLSGLRRGLLLSRHRQNDRSFLIESDHDGG